LKKQISVPVHLSGRHFQHNRFPVPLSNPDGCLFIGTQVYLVPLLFL
jgi:hypothetical protein